MRKLWGRKNSSNVMKVIWLLEELHLPYERIDVGGPFGRTHDPDYLAMNPNSVVPTLEEENGFTLWESNAILRYLASTHASGMASTTGGAATIWPEDLQARANIDRWMDWQQTTQNAPASIVFQGLVRTPPEQRDASAIETGMINLGQAYALLDAQLARDGYVAGPEFTLADIPLGVHVHRWFSLAVMRPDLPYLRAWYDRLLQRPAFHDHCAAPLT